MKNIKYIIFTIVFLFLNVFYVSASCTNEEISVLKEEAKKIKITYRHKGPVETEEDIFYNQFDVTIKNLSDDFYVSLLSGSTILDSEDGIAKVELTKGKWPFKIYSKKCGVLIDVIDVFLPTFNIYSLEPLCDGIDGDDFPLCGKYYEYNVSYNEFEKLVNEYRKKYISDENSTEDNQNNLSFNLVISYIKKYQVYILVSLVFILILLISIIIYKGKKKRGVLK